MSQKPIDTSKSHSNAEMWAKLLEDVKKEDAANPNSTDEEKRLLDQLDQLSDEEWEPIICEGERISTTIIQDRR